jgi:aryl-phospho-beta-D-glucosidase BglC (GH1 family)
MTQFFLRPLVTHFRIKPWVTPSLFDNTGNPNIVDEWTFGQLQDQKTALNTLQNHWNTWITESDFAAIAAAGRVLAQQALFFDC